MLSKRLQIYTLFTVSQRFTPINNTQVQINHKRDQQIGQTYYQNIRIRQRTHF